MKRRSLAATLAMGLAGALFVAPIQASAGPSAQPAPVPALGQRHAATPVALSAVEQISRSSLGSDGRLHTTQQSNKLYRDNQGRTRHESGSTVTISDPVSGTTLRLDARTGTYTKTSPPQRTSQPSETNGSLTTKQKQLSSAPRSLGTAWFGNVRAQGNSYTVTTPRNNAKPITQEVTSWLSPEIQLDVQTRVVDSSGAGYTKTYTDIRTAITPAADLFAVPPGYHEVDPVAAVQDGPGCPLSITPDPLVLVSFSAYLGYGYHIGITDVNNACIIPAAAAVLEYPLYVALASPLLLPAAALYWQDNGGPLPWVPYTAFGASGFLATNVDYSTEAWSLVVLYIF